MADLSDVEQSLVSAISAALYPNGTNNPSAVTAPGIVTVSPAWRVEAGQATVAG
jgi:hypothetical protein